MRRQSSQSVVFLTEILLALMIFALCSSVCASLFSWSHQINRESSALRRAVIAAQARLGQKHGGPSTVGVWKSDAAILRPVKRRFVNVPFSTAPK
jgi:uncharacterized protein YcfL